jgi:hypothetical protein
MAPEHYEGLEVNTQAQLQSSGPEHIAYDKSYPEPLPYNEKEVHHAVGVGATPSGEKRRVCGLRRTVFITLVVGVILVVAAGIGGGVGGALSIKKKSSSPKTR